MKEYDPWGAATVPKINIRPRFDFDSDLPVVGEIHKPDTGMMLKTLEWAFVIDLIIFEAWACQWWYYYGWPLMRGIIGEYLPWLLKLSDHGQF